MHHSGKNRFQTCLSALLAFVLVFAAIPTATHAFASEEALTEERDIIYSFSADAGIQDQEIGATGTGAMILGATPHLTGSGSPTFTIVDHPEEGNSLQISGRDADWHTIDLVRSTLDLDARNTYTLTVNGRILGGPAGAQAQIARTGGTWGPFVSATPAADGTFTLTLTVDAALHAELTSVGGNGFRIRTNGTDDFIIDDITVYLPRGEEVYIPAPGVGTLIPENITLAPNRVRGFEIDGFGVDRSELSWHLSGNLSPHTTIEDGYLRIADDNPLGTIVLRAYVTADPTIYGIAVITVGGASSSIIHDLPAGLNFDAYPSLREVYADYFLMGVAGDTGQINTTPLGQLRSRLVGHHYNSWSFENSMKVQPLRGNNAANRLQPSSQWPGVQGPRNTMNAARAAYPQMSFAGHTTAWHSQSPDWMWDRHAGGNANREIALENLYHHIRGTFTEFGTEISSMDVVNEAIGSVSPTNPGNWRDAITRGEGWAPTLGYYWVMYAFIFAAEIVDELELDVTLYYNDFLLHTTNKGYSVYRMVGEINDMHAAGEVIHPITGEVFRREDGRLLIEGIGMQDRQSGIIDIDGFSDAINMFASLGVVVAITEMDLSWRVTSPDGLLTPEEQIGQGQQLARFFEMIRRYASGPATAGSPYPRVVERITFWGVDDLHSWAPGEPMLFGRPDVANNFIPGKEALRAVLDPFQFLEDHPWVPEELPPVPGVHIFDLAEDGFTGANIILGNDQTVWPFSTAGDDGVVAFTPQPGATYRLLVRYQTFGTYGLEAHWITDDSADNFTPASIETALTMGTITRGSGAGPAANAIPTRFFNPGVGGSFAWLETVFTMPADGAPGGLLGNIALRGINGGNEFGIYSIEITRINQEGDDTLLVNYPFLLPLVRPEIPGIIVPEPNDAQNNGRADIIIGTGRDVWPFADAHPSGVAFDPVPGVTYRIMFNMRTTSAGGWRVRWIPGVGGEDYTTADGAVVNSYPLRVSSFGLGVPTPDLISAMPVASFIPSHQNSGVSAAGVYTIVQDITLTGNEEYQGLIGNIALRGTGGSGNFVVNWISIQELSAGPGSEAVETLNFWPFGADAFDDFKADPIVFMETVEGFTRDHFEPNVLNVANNSLMPITRQGTNPIINVANPPHVGETLVAGRISGGNGTGSGLRTGTTQGFLAGNAQYEWLVNGEVVQSGLSNTLTLLPAHAGHTVQVRMTSDWETGQLTSAATPVIEGSLGCDVLVDGQFTGTGGSMWRICADGTLEIDEGAINWINALSPWHNYRDLITQVEITGPIRAGASLRALFRELTFVTEIAGLTYFDTSATTSMYRMFFGLSGVTELDVTSFATNDVTNMALMFRDASSLVELDVSNFDTSNVVDMREMFRGTSIEVLDLSGFDTSSVTNMNHMFTALHTLRELTLGESFSFIGTPNLVPIRQTESDTGLWQGEGVALTSAQLMAQFDGSTMAGTFVRQTWTEADPEICEIVARGRFANGTHIGGAQWHLCDDGTLEIGSGFINWTLVTSPWHAYRTDITEIVFTGEVLAGPSLRSLFHDLHNLEEIHNLAYLDTSQVANMARMFRGASSLTDLDLSTFDTGNVTDMSWMFFGASGLETLDVTHFVTNHVTDMALMFRETSSLTELDVSNFDTSSVTDMREMFRGMSSLTILDLDNFDTTGVMNMNHMFVGMSALTELILGDLFTPIGSPGIPRLH